MATRGVLRDRVPREAAMRESWKRELPFNLAPSPLRLGSHACRILSIRKALMKPARGESLVKDILSPEDAHYQQALEVVERLARGSDRWIPNEADSMQAVERDEAETFEPEATIHQRELRKLSGTRKGEWESWRLADFMAGRLAAKVAVMSAYPDRVLNWHGVIIRTTTCDSAESDDADAAEAAGPAPAPTKNKHSKFIDKIMGKTSTRKRFADPYRDWEAEYEALDKLDPDEVAAVQIRLYKLMGHLRPDLKKFARDMLTKAADDIVRRHQRTKPKEIFDQILLREPSWGYRDRYMRWEPLPGAKNDDPFGSFYAVIRGRFEGKHGMPEKKGAPQDLARLWIRQGEREDSVNVWAHCMGFKRFPGDGISGDDRKGTPLARIWWEMSKPVTPVKSRGEISPSV